MSRKVNDYAIDDVIQGIKDTLNRHSASIRSEISSRSRNTTPERNRDLSSKISSLESSRNFEKISTNPKSLDYGWSFKPHSKAGSPIMSPGGSLASEAFQKYLGYGIKSPLSSDSIRGLSSRLESIPSPNHNLEITIKEQNHEINHLNMLKDQLCNQLEDAKKQCSEIKTSKDKQINELIEK